MSTPKYIAHLVQEGDGCGYMIECGTKVVSLDAETYEAAQDEMEALVREEYGFGSERTLQSVTLHEVSRSSLLDVRAVYKEMRAEAAAKEVARREAVEREQYAALHARFGSKG